jgi:trigger factor
MMEVTEVRVEGLKREYRAIATAAEIEARIDAKIKDLQPTAQLKGFRKGKAPTSLLKKMFGKSMHGEVMRQVVDETVRNHLEQNNHRPAMQPNVKIVNDSFDAGDDLNLEFYYELMPEIPELNLKEIELERLTVATDDAAVEDALRNFAKNAKSFVTKDGAAENGDQVVMDFVGSIDGEKFDGGAAEDFPLELGGGRFIPGFEDQLVGVCAGDAKDVNVTFPEDYSATALAGKAAVFAITVKEVRSAQDAEIDDALAKRFGSDNLNALRERIRAGLSEEYRVVARGLLKRQLLDKLEENLSFEVPPTMLDDEAKNIAHQMRHDEHAAAHEHEHEDEDQDHEDQDDEDQDHKDQGHENQGHENQDHEDQDHERIEVSDEHRKLANRRVRLGLYLQELGSKNEIRVSDPEISQEAARRAGGYAGEEKAFYDWIMSNAQMKQQISAPIFENKVVDFIFEQASVTERAVSADELKAEVEKAEDDDDTSPAA